MRRLPSLGALRAFEAAARNLSFTAAANELCVTQAAISHQIRQLEGWLGFALFERRGHSLTLTSKGSAYLPDLTDAFDRMSAATLRLRERTDGPLRVTVLPSFASRWLVPRLNAFRVLHPEVGPQASPVRPISGIFRLIASMSPFARASAVGPASRRI